MTRSSTGSGLCCTPSERSEDGETSVTDALRCLPMAGRCLAFTAAFAIYAAMAAVAWVLMKVGLTCVYNLIVDNL